MLKAAMAALLLGSAPCMGQAPPDPAKAWEIPESVFQRAAALNSREIEFAHKPYDLAGLVDLAERINPDTHAAWEVAREAAAAEGLAETAYLPQLSLQAAGGFEHTPLPAPKDLSPAGYFVSDTREVVPALALKWLLFDFGQRDAAVEAARADSFVARVAFTGEHQRLVFAVSKAYFDLGATRGRLRAARKALSTAQTTQDAAVARRSNGLATVVAVAQAQRQTAQARYGLAAAEGAERSAAASLRAAVGVPSGASIEVADSADSPLPATPSMSVSKAVSQALSHRPDILADIGRLDAAAADLKGARRAFYPVISLEGRAFQNFGSISSDGRPYSTIDRPGQSILLSFSVPLFDGGARRSKVAMADAKVHEAQQDLIAAQQSASQQIVQAYDGLVTSLAEYEAASALSGAAHTAYDAALNAYRQGVGTYTDVATEENAVVEGDTQVEDARAGAHTAAAALALAMGASGVLPANVNGSEGEDAR